MLAPDVAGINAVDSSPCSEITLPPLERGKERLILIVREVRVLVVAIVG